MKRNQLALAAACVSFAVIANAEELRLKTRTIDPALESPAATRLQAATANPRSVTGQRYRFLVQFATPDPDLSDWTARGARIMASVPVNGYILSAPASFNPENLEHTYFAPIGASDKISPALAAAELTSQEAPQPLERNLVIVHFHKDVEAWEADGILAAESVEPIQNSSLEATDRLVELSPAQLAALALWDEVEYIFPAPDAMRDGEIFLVCGGVFSGTYEVAMLAASFGEGWDGPGRGRASITYSFGNLGARTNPTQTRAEVRRALDQWSRAAAVTFTETNNRSAARNIDIFFATGAHGDPFPFNAGSTVLGHSFYPAPPNPEPFAGDIHINDAWSWSIGGQWDVFSVMLHEVGHSLGIGHTDIPGSVMYPYYQKAEALRQMDIDSIRQLYAAPEDAPAPPLSLTLVSPIAGTILSGNTVNLTGSIRSGGPGLSISYLNETTNHLGPCLINSIHTTFTCAAIPLANGLNRLRATGVLNSVTVVETREIRRDAPAAPVLRILSPANIHSTTAGEIRISGSASHPQGIASLTWRTSHGRSGTASGLTSWAATVPLQAGPNTITFTATARNGVLGSQQINIQRSVPSTPSPIPGEDEVPPRMTIQQPIGNFIITSARKLTFRGSATDNVGVTKVTWTNSAGSQSGAANATLNKGVVNWTFDVNIAVGFNSIQVRAWDPSGNSTLYSTTVRRY